MKHSGTIVRGVKAPIIRSGDNLEKIVVDSLDNCLKEGNIELNDKDVVAITEAVVAKAQGNYATIDQIAKDIKNKFGNGTVGLIFPILSRNRFSLLLKAITKGVDKLIIQLSYPCDEVGNHLLSLDELDEKGINPYDDVFTYEEFRKLFPVTKHPFTNIDYIEYYKEIGNCEIILANNPLAILKYTNNILVGSIHSRKRLKNIYKKNKVNCVYGLDDILTNPIEESGYNEEYGLLGSNMATENSVKLFPHNPKVLVDNIQKLIFDKYQKKVEVMVYGDGAFKDPVGGIWELADPVISPSFTDGLIGTPNELKFKYIADNSLKNLSNEQATDEMKKMIKNKNKINIGDESLGTTPRRITDLLGSLADLTSGSGDKGTPIILIQNYFNNYADE